MKSIEGLDTCLDDLVCVRCGGALVAHDATLECTRCTRAYPIQGGIPVLLHRPAAALAVCRLSITADRANAEAVEHQSRAALRRRPSAALRQRVERWRRGTRANLDLVQAHAGPLAPQPGSDPDEALGILDWVACQASGWSIHRLLPYFHQDWCGTPQFEEVRSVVVGAWRRYGKGAGGIAVLGAGACGLVHALAREAGPVYGVDLCLPALLLARTLLGGNPLDVALEGAEWRSVHVPPPPPAEHRIALIQANVNALPFADGALSVVVTQYLMDLVGSPLWLCAELHRVLRPGGIWVNFSNPFAVPGEPIELDRPGLAEVRELLATSGFEVLEAERREFALNDLCSVLPSAIRHAEEVHFFVAMRGPDANLLPEGRRWMRDDDWWQQTVQPVPGREVDILRQTRPGAAAAGESVAVRSHGATFPVPDDVGDFVAQLFGQLAEGARLVELWDRFERNGLPFSRAEFRELMHLLIEHHGLLETWGSDSPSSGRPPTMAAH